MDDSLRNKLLADLQKSGFGAEMKAADAFLHAGWQVSPASTYLDLDEGKLRSVDFAAVLLKRRQREHIEIDVEYHLSVEVKKSEKPWIAFRRPSRETPGGYSEGWANPYVAVLPFRLSALSDVLTSTSLPAALGWYAHGLHESFKNPDQPSRWYSAFVTACKAAHDYTKHECFKQEYMEHFDYPFLVLSNPVVVLDGLLFTAELTPSGEVALEEQHIVPFRFDFGSGHYEPREFRIDVVCLRGLRDYLTHLDARAQAVFEEIEKTYDAGSEHDAAQDGEFAGAPSPPVRAPFEEKR
jgi:hypothetical protein